MDDPFVDYLHSLYRDRNLGALATLRRGLGRQVGEVPELFKYVIPHLQNGVSSWEEQVYYLVASLFAMHPMPGGDGDLGSVLREVDLQSNRGSKAGDEGMSAVERRLLILLRSDRSTLPDHLRQAISLASSKDVPIDWNCLLWDLKRWNRDDRLVQKKWADSFWKMED